MSYASIAAHNSEGGGAKPSQEWLEGSLPASTNGKGSAGQVQTSIDVDSGSINVVPHGSNLDNLRTDSAEKAERAERDAREHQRKLDEEATNDANVQRDAHDARVQAGHEATDANKAKTDVKAQESEKNAKKVNATAEEKYKEGKAFAEEKYQEGKTFVENEAKKAKKWADREAPKLSKDAKKAEKTLARKAKEVSAQVQQGWGQLSSDPKAWGTLLGAVNIALLGGLGYFVYRERNNTRSWDRRCVSAVTVGVLGLLGGQGYVAAETAREQRGKK